MAQTAENLEVREESVRGAFHDALQQRRAAVVARARRLPACDALSDLVFGLFSRIATPPGQLPSADLLDAELSKRSLRREDLRLPGGGGAAPADVWAVLSGTARPPGAVEVVNALFAIGYSRHLAPLSTIERRNFTLSVVAFLPAVEAIGPFVLSDFVDLASPEEDALRFWQIYVDRVAAEIGRRTRPNPGQATEPWHLSRLVRLHQLGPSGGHTGSWLSLKQHVNRVLQTRRHRWRFIRSLAEGCHDPRMLHYLCTAPAMVEDGEVVRVFLTRGNSKLISCALFALQVHADQDAAIDDVLDHFRGRPLPEVGERLVEIFAQLHLIVVRAPCLERLRAGICELVGQRVSDGPVEPLLGAVSADARALRQVVLLAEAIDEHGRLNVPQIRTLLERVVAAFMQSFTPSGVDHFLNDEVFRGAVRRALHLLALSGAEETRQRLERFGVELSELVDKWVGNDAPPGTAERMLGRFASLYAHTIVSVCRALYGRPDTRERGLRWYQTLVRVFAAHPLSTEATGWFGAIEHVVPSLFPDLINDGRNAAQDRVAEAADLVAHVELELWPQAEPSEVSAPLLFPRHATGAHRAVGDSALGAHVAGLITRPTRAEPLSAPVTVIDHRDGAARSFWRAYTGIELLSELGRGLRRALGYRVRGELTLTDHELLLTAETRLSNESVDRQGISHSLSDLTAVSVRQRMRWFYASLGIGALLTAGTMGGHLLFVGLRGAEGPLMLVGGGLICLGYLFDAAMNRLAVRGRRTVLLELHTRARRRPLTVLVDTEEGAELLDAFMANDAERREMEMLERWSAMDVSWEAFDDGDAEHALDHED